MYIRQRHTTKSSEQLSSCTTFISKCSWRRWSIFEKASSSISKSPYGPVVEQPVVTSERESESTGDRQSSVPTDGARAGEGASGSVGGLEAPGGDAADMNESSKSRMLGAVA